jgi:hypothetical protein
MERDRRKQMTQSINEDLKEMLSFHETLSLVCFNINYSKRFEAITLEKLSGMLAIDAERLEKALRIISRIGMARLSSVKDKLMVEMTDPEDSVVKNTIFDVMWEKRFEYSVIYKNMVQGELIYKAANG